MLLFVVAVCVVRLKGLQHQALNPEDSRFPEWQQFLHLRILCQDRSGEFFGKPRNLAVICCFVFEVVVLWFGLRVEVLCGHKTLQTCFPDSTIFRYV